MELALYSAVLLSFFGITPFFAHALLKAWREIPPFVPSARSAVAALPAFLPLPPGSVFYDLGAGDGRIVRAMARAYPESTCIGVEKYWIPYLLAKLRNAVRPLPNVRFVRGDLLSVPLASATHVYLYLYPHTIATLFRRGTFPSGCMVVSCDFKYAGKEPDKTVFLGAETFGKALYFYRF